MALRRRLHSIWLMPLALLLAGAGLGQPAAGQDINGTGAERPFLAESEAAMDRMMRHMSILPGGDVDRDFALMMAPHHQGAIDMALVFLRYGRNEQLRRLAQEIIITQQQEIAAMRRAVGDALPPLEPAPGQQVPGSDPMPSHMKHLHQEP